MLLRIGSKGDVVRQLQTKLQESGFDPGPVDGKFGNSTRKAVVEFQASKKLEADGIVGPVTLEALGLKVKLVDTEFERRHFKKLLLKNPNYFGNLKVSKYKAVKVLKNKTTYEELKCVGYNPHLEQLEAVVYIKKDYGFGGNLCSSGSTEYVRFFVDWKNDGNWQDVGMARFKAHNIPGDKPLEYAVTLKLDPKEKFCTIENLPRIKAILSWNNPPTAGDPDFVPVWGNALEARIQIDALRLFILKDLVKMAELEFPEVLLQSLDLSQPVSTLEPKELSLAELKEIYKDKGVPAHRFAFKELHKMLAKSSFTKGDGVDFIDILSDLKIDKSKLVDSILKTDGNTRYEELKCLGYDQKEESLIGTLTVKLPYGYKGGLCKKGSFEHVAFWEWDEIENLWLYLGTASVKVHDIKSVPNEGLQYAVFLPVDFSHRRRPCAYGASEVRIRAIMSWETPPPPDNPHWIPTWGNREETRIHIKPGPVQSDEQIIYMDTVGDMAVCDIDQANGLAAGEGVISSIRDADDSPFGRTVTITGFIDNAPKYVIEGTQAPSKYKVSVRPHDPVNPQPWQPLSNSFKVKVLEQAGSGSIPVQKSMQQKVDPVDGYYPYLEDIHGSAWRRVSGRVLAKWETNKSMTGLWEIKIEAKTALGISIASGIILCGDGSTRSSVRLRLDNKKPDPSIAIIGVQHGGSGSVNPAAQCGEFLVGDVIHGTYAVSDEHFGVLTLSVIPSGPAHGATVNPSVRAYNVVPGTGESGTWSLDTSGMDPCGYVVRLWTRDRTIVDSAVQNGWRNHADVGFCLELADAGASAEE
jgi:hypothetical protein